jgi:hypothetical protein
MDESPENWSSLFSVIDELATLEKSSFFAGSRIIDKEPDLEACLRRVLRPHDEAGFESPRDNWIIDLRSRLDRALGELTLREIRNQLGLTNNDLSASMQESLRILFRSEAFLRYVNAYLYFGIRFLASREEHKYVSQDKDLPTCADSNVQSFLLFAPPKLTGDFGVEEKLEDFRKLSRQEPIQTALLFLDDFHPPRKQAVQYELQEPSEYELWLRDLRPDIEEGPQNQRFRDISEGLTAWVLSRSDFYLSLSPPTTVEISSEETPGAEASETKNREKRPLEGWLVTHPLAARLALADIYWIARLLRADVSENASVTYQKHSWVHLLRFHALLADDKEGAGKLRKAEDAIRSVFGYVCDLIQNSVELTREHDRREAQSGKSDELPDQTWKWRAVFDEELDEIEKQRRVRRFRDPSLPVKWSPAGNDPMDPIVWRSSGEPEQPPSEAAEGIELSGGSTPPALDQSGSRTSCSTQSGSPGSDIKGWSKRIKTGERPNNLIGLAFSGGGIRSATFNLGILQGLQELDLLRHMDYLSTVSGGGFIGSWLVANVRRSSYWLGRLTDWSASIAHLREYSNYLAPRTGILSADTWNLANSWFRNAFLIQLTGLAWLFVLLLATLAGQRIFLILADHSVAGIPWATMVGLAMGVLVTITILYNLNGTILNTASNRRRSNWVRWLAVTPAWIGAFALASHLGSTASLNSQDWSILAGLSQYSDLFRAAWRPWLLILSSAGAAFFVIAFVTLKRNKYHALWIGPFCTLVLYLELVAVFLVLRIWSVLRDSTALAFVFSPALVLLSFGICVLLLIGFTGRNTDEGFREWWTRFGTWLAIFSGVGVFISAVAVFGPGLILWFFSPSSGEHHLTLQSIKWTSVLGWLGTVIGGLLAGKSSKTSGEGESNNSHALELLARAGGFLFIVGSFLLGSTLLYVLMFELFASESSLSTSCFQVLGEFSGWQIPIALGFAVAIGSLFSWFFEINIFGLNQFYRNRLVRCYLGATRWIPGLRIPNPFTKFDFNDDLKLSRFRTDSPREGQPGEECEPYRGPFPIVNCTLNLGGSSDLALNTRHSSSFTLSPLRCGCDRPAVGYAPTWSKEGSFADGVQLGQAVAISGAAVSSNMGYNTSPLVAFLLTMFNVRLGWWFPNPGQPSWRRRGLSFSLYYMVMELLGIAGEKRYFLNASDGGHFENLGIYELIRRRCRLIIACDAECDEELQFGGLGNVIRICETDFGAIIDIDVKSIRLQEQDVSLAHCAVGQIKYSNGDIGFLIYLKASITGDEDVSITQYRSSHPSFPHETTANQFFSEDQFESYRGLGLHIVRNSFKGNLPGDDPLIIAEKMADVLTPAGPPSESFLKHSKSLREIWDKFRASAKLLTFMKELITLPTPGQVVLATPVDDDELCIGLELIQLMEDVFLDLRLDDFWEHPDNRGWAILFMRWSRSPRFRLVWKQTKRTFGIRFEYFCAARLGLERDEHIVRV